MTSPTQPELARILETAAPRRHRKLGYVLAATAVLAGVAIWFGLRSRAQATSAAPPYETVALARGDISLSIVATGNLGPTNEVTVGSELSGTVQEVYVETNDRVSKGQPLAMLNTTRLNQSIESSRARIRSADAGVAVAAATLKENQTALARIEEVRRLTGDRLPSQADLDAAAATFERSRAQLLAAEAAVGEAEASLRIHEDELSKAIIRSPIDGIVLTRAIEPGQTVAATFTAPELFVIAESLEQMKLTVTVAEADIGRLDKGQNATFTVDAWPGRTYVASVRKVAYGSSITDNVVTYETELDVDNDDLSLRPGMTATAEIQVAESHDVFVVPDAALRFQPATTVAAAEPANRTFVQNLAPFPRRFARPQSPGGGRSGSASRSAQLWILRDGEPHAIRVRTGLSSGGRTEVIGDDLTEGLPIVIRAR